MKTFAISMARVVAGLSLITLAGCGQSAVRPAAAAGPGGGAMTRPDALDQFLLQAEVDERARQRALAAADVVMADDYGMIQVVVSPAMQEPLKEWLAWRGLHLYQIPVEDDLPTYGTGTTAPAFPAAAGETPEGNQ